MVDGYPNFEWSPVNPITGDDNSEYEHSEGFQEEIFLEYEVDIPDLMEDEDAIQKIVKDEYHEEDPNIISE